MKLGDGATAWNSLAYFAVPDVDVIYAPLTNPAIPDLIFTVSGDVVMVPD
jgi:hypothetical protein